MQSNFTPKTPATDTYEHLDEAHEVRRLDAATNDLMGPVVVGGRAEADCFRCADALQAGHTDPYAYGKEQLAINDGDADDKNIPTCPW